MTRRSILLALCLAFTLPALAQPVTHAWHFQVYLDEKPIGFHTFQVAETGDVRQVTSEARFDVKVLLLNLYRYRHSNSETWQNNCLASISSETDANGKNYQVRGTLAGQGFAIDASDRSALLPPCVMSFAYWNPAFLTQANLLNAQTGRYEPVTITRMQHEMLDYNGRQLPSVRYQVETAAGPITLWYHAHDARWLALASPAKGGRVLRYQPLEIPALPIDIALR